MPPLHPRSTRLAGALLVALTLPLFAQTPAADPAAAEAAPADAAATPAPAIAKNDPAILDAEIEPRASRALLLDITRTSSGLFAVGERGHALTSGDDGKTWTQLKVPTRSALTAIASADGQLWAGGHDGVIVHSADGGQTWQRQRVAPWSADDQDPTHGVPVLDLMFTDASNGIAVGAYSLLLVTHDAGVTWTPQKVSLGSAAPAAAAKPQGDDWTFSSDQLALSDEADPHFNAIARTDSGAMVIVGERGTFLRSTDGGATWSKGRFPYQGSMFGVMSWPGGGDHILVFGLRGNAYESDDLGNTWRKVETGGKASLLGGQPLANGGAVLVGANGLVLTRKDGNSPFVAATFANKLGEIPVLAGVQAAESGQYVLIGDKGADLYLPK
ncbi:WD40/YVTN/BNR-like repeat-containing protein [Arenimonas oryziterrae]|uniref:DUF6242 domain-containing protein n=1 Tax=Arenimonas oryziterrae DSM 21050 = YC6267 TaxID=1121015 RepID=A0A091AT45_9GAMM|nr:YCF48-related protein [Arenimonas oryziterrae]KFN42501.1 hypothetical protein N789_12745 [Arenimonas oryziterrae DSM 21050 = YC6267]